MRQVVYATLPGLAVLVWQFGLGSLLNDRTGTANACGAA